MGKFLLVLLFAFGGAAQAGGIKILEDFPEEAAVMRAQNVAMVVLFTQEDCHYCEIIKTDFLQPMQLSGDYETRVLLRERPMDDYAKVLDANGNEVPARDFSRRYDVDFSPTVLLLDANGQPLTKPLIGFSGADYYGFYLDKRIAAAVDQIK